MECFKVIGYYICEVRDIPEWLHGISGQLLSVSGCLGEQHPRWGRGEDASRSKKAYDAGWAVQGVLGNGEPPL